jgi:hypothetical protein
MEPGMIPESTQTPSYPMSEADSSSSKGLVEFKRNATSTKNEAKHEVASSQRIAPPKGSGESGFLQMKENNPHQEVSCHPIVLQTKDQLIQTIKKWVKTDNEIRSLQKEVSLRKKQKKAISNDLMEVMRKNEIDCFDINDGQIIYVKKNVKKPITQKMLLNILNNYYEGEIDKANDLNNFIMNSREEIVKETIIRKII